MTNKFILLYFLFFSTIVTFSQNHVLITNPGEPDVATESDFIASDELSKGSKQEISDLQKTMWCATSNTLVSGYPAWTHSWAGWMVNIKNVSSNTITINCFEARFQGTSGYRIYTKTGTFVGFEATAGAWSLVGSVASGVVGASTTTSSAIPITVNVNINPGATQAFYLTRTDNTSTNRHLYIAGAGTAGTTVYASDANIQVTEGNYVDVYFILMGGPRRPSFQIYYSILNPLPIELSDFKCSSDKTGTVLNWATANEKNNAYFAIERSSDGINFEEIGKVNGAGNSSKTTTYTYKDNYAPKGINYYRLIQTEFNNETTIYNTIACISEPGSTKIKVYNSNGILLSTFISEDYVQTINQMDLIQGVYIIELQNDENPYFIKYVKQ